MARTKVRTRPEVPEHGIRVCLRVRPRRAHAKWSGWSLGETILSPDTARTIAIDVAYAAKGLREYVIETRIVPSNRNAGAP